MTTTILKKSGTAMTILGDDDSIRYKTQIEIELSIDPPGVLLSTSKLLGI